jgi:uncharacterized protein YecE (DUF72 family)
MNDIRLGTSGYSFDDWYPSHVKGPQMFHYYVDQLRLRTVEINYTFYRMPSARVFDFYVNKSPDSFDFTVKLFGGITHDPCQNGIEPVVDKDLCARFIDGIRPLVESGKLGCILAQFPPHLSPGKSAWDYLLSLHDSLRDYKLVYEFRNKKWVSEKTISALKRVGVGYCAVDCPQVGPLMPLVPAVTSNIGYLRLHGRNKKWFADKSVRYDYLYSMDELKGFLPTIYSMASMCSTVYVQFNNCHAGSALRNVKMMQCLLGQDEPPLQGVLFGF